MCTRIMKYSNF
uniref:BLTX557 n=1 Tax=Nephila pilipes TaxID=299642 RepID=A0A076KV40_NEPPI|nr:BLTX557 [Nephila pilipes]